MYDQKENLIENGRIEFKIEFEDIDSESELNSQPYDLLDLD